MSISGNATWLFGLFKISCLFIAPFENVMGFFTLKTQIKCSPRVPPEPLCVPLGVCVPKFGNRCSISFECSSIPVITRAGVLTHTLSLSRTHPGSSHTHTHTHTPQVTSTWSRCQCRPRPPPHPHPHTHTHTHTHNHTSQPTHTML